MMNIFLWIICFTAFFNLKAVHNNNGLTELHYAAKFANQARIEFLVQEGADINATDDKGMTALHHVIYSKPTSSRKIVTFLLENGADPNLQPHTEGAITHILLRNIRDSEFFPNGSVDLSLLDILLHAGTHFGITFLLKKLLAASQWISTIDSQEKKWENNTANSIKFEYLMKNYPSLTLHILIKIFKEPDPRRIDYIGVTESFADSARYTFSKLKEPELLEKLRFFYANQLLLKWKRRMSKDFKKILTRRSLALSSIDPKFLDTEINNLIVLCQADEFSKSAAVKELNSKIEEQTRAFMEITCRNLAKSFLANNQEQHKQNNVKLICVNSNDLSSEYLSLGLEFNKLLVKLPKKYSSECKKIEKECLLNKHQILINFYNYLQSIIDLQGKLSGINAGQQQPVCFGDKDILSQEFIEAFKAWSNQSGPKVLINH